MRLSVPRGAGRGLQAGAVLLVLASLTPAFGQDLVKIKLSDASQGPVLLAPKAFVASETPKATEATPASDKPAEETKASEPAAPALLPLSKEMTALRDQVRRTLVRCFQVPVNTNTNSVSDVLDFCLAFGTDAEIRQGNQAVNGLGALCWNFSCAGYYPLLADGRAILPRQGFGFQEYPGELLAVLGQAGVPASYELRVGERRGTVADLVAWEKAACRAGSVQAHRLIGLACYIQDDQVWKNDLGEEWSLKRLLRDELDRGVALDSSATTDRMMGISYAMQRRRLAKLPVDSEYARAERFVEEFQGYTLAAQNSDGSWHPSFFTLRGASRDALGLLDASGRITEWLVYSLPDTMLTDPRVVRAVSYLPAALEGQLSRWSPSATSSKEMAAFAHAARALMIYDRSVFRPYDAEKAAAEKKPAP